MSATDVNESAEPGLASLHTDDIAADVVPPYDDEIRRSTAQSRVYSFSVFFQLGVLYVFIWQHFLAK